METEPQAKPRISLTIWILALTSVPVLAALGLALFALAKHPENENDLRAADALARVAPAVDQALERDGEALERLATVVARDPKFFAVLTIPVSERTADFQNAIATVLRDFQRDAETPLFLVTDERGVVLARATDAGGSVGDVSRAEPVRGALAGRPGSSYLVERGRVFRVAAVPVRAGGELVGALCLGRPVDEEVCQTLKAAMEVDVVVTVDDRVAASTIPPSPIRKVLTQRIEERSLESANRRDRDRREVAPARGDRGGKGDRSGKGAVGDKSADGEAAGSAQGTVDVVSAGGARYLVLRKPLEGARGASGLFLVRPLKAEASPLASLRSELLYAGGSGLLLALLGGTVIALGVRRLKRRAAMEHEGEIDRIAKLELARDGLVADAAATILDPASTILTIHDLIEDGALGDLSGPQRDGLLAIRRAAEALVRAGSDLSSLSLLHRRQLPLALEPVDLGGLVERVATDLVPLAAERRQTVSLAAEPDLMHPAVDPKHFAHAVQNVALEAMRHAPDGAILQLGARRSAKGIAVLVADSGGGSPDGASGDGSLFAGRRDGLSLTVASGIVEAHGGTLGFAGDSHFGMTFVLELPLPTGKVETSREPALALAS